MYILPKVINGFWGVGEIYAKPWNEFCCFCEFSLLTHFYCQGTVFTWILLEKWNMLKAAHELWAFGKIPPFGIWSGEQLDDVEDSIKIQTFYHKSWICSSSPFSTQRKRNPYQIPLPWKYSTLYKHLKIIQMFLVAT